MVQVLKRRGNLREKYYTMQPTPRVERLRQTYLNLRNRAVIDRLRIGTRIMKETEGEPVITRRVKMFTALVRELPVNIYPDEPFVGWLASVPRGSEFSLMLEPELDTLSTRQYMPFLISDEDKRELREEIFPYWKTRYTAYRALPTPPELQKAGITVSDSGFHALIHFIVNYRKVLEKGLQGIKKEAEERLSRLDLTNPEDVKRVSFLQGVIASLEVAAEFGGRFALQARELAKKEKDPARKAELLKIAGICDRVPAYPARTFHEALQSVWFIIILSMMASDGLPYPGRADQYLYPYYENDIKEGRLTKEQAQELIDCWFMRFSQRWLLQTLEAERHASSYTPSHHIHAGGLKADGTDATNDLSYMFIEAMMHTPGMVEPTLSVLVHSKTPEDLLIKACQLTSMGGGFPMYINNDLMVNNLLARGAIVGGPPVTLEIAREYGSCAGCHEPTLATMESGWNPSTVVVPVVLELVLTNGVLRLNHKKIGLETGDPRSFKSFEEFREAYRQQLVGNIKRGIMAKNIEESLTLEPTLFASALIDDCIEKGRAREHGGARYSIGGISVRGTVDAGNSLAAIKKLVFDDKKITMAQLCDALEKNFEGYDHIRKLCLEAPKFGNDDDYVDEQVAWVTQVITDEAKKYKTVYGGPRFCEQNPVSAFIMLGKLVGALPSGRLAWEPLGDGVSPTYGSDVNGPTSVLKSVGKIDNAAMSLGQTLNMKLSPVVFEADDGIKKLADLIRVLVDQKVDHIQINVVSAETLKAAQKEPEKHKDLVVKVAGYNARFIELYKELQDSIIARMEHKL